MSEFLPPELIDGGNPQKSTPKKSLVLPLLLILLGISLGGTLLYLNSTYPSLFSDTYSKIADTLNRDKQSATDSQEQMLLHQNSSTKKPRPSHSPYPLVPDDGTAGTYKISHATGSGPKVVSLRLDPLDAKQGSEVKITVTLTHPSSISDVDVKATFEDRNTSTTLSRLSRNNNTEVWEGVFTITGENLYTYIIDINSRSTNETSTLRMGLRI